MLPELNYVRPRTLEEALAFLARYPSGTRMVAGGTDLLIELRREGLGVEPLRLLDLSGLASLSGLRERDGQVTIGALTPHAVLAGSAWLEARAALLQQAAASVGAIQIRNRGTVGGNLVNAAPCADLVGPLVALGAKVHLCSLQGEREIPLEAFITGPYQTELRPDEILSEVVFEPLPANASSSYVRLGRREALAIMRLSVSVILFRDGQGKVEECRIVPGAATSTVHRIAQAESLLVGQAVDEALAGEVGEALSARVVRETGYRWSTPYKERVMIALCRRAILQAAGLEKAKSTRATVQWAQGEATAPIESEEGVSSRAAQAPTEAGRIRVRFSVNGEPREIETEANRTLVEVLREDFQLTGTKVGCEIGECGACTVLMDGKAVNSCLVLIGQVEGRDIITIEGLARSGELHPLQEAFVEKTAVQCGFCTSGMILSAKALLDVKPQPSREEIIAAISGNLCRCTGYEQIIQAIEAASAKRAAAGRGGCKETPSEEAKG